MGTTLLCYQDSESYLHSKSLAEVYHLHALLWIPRKETAGRQRRGDLQDLCGSGILELWVMIRSMIDTTLQ